MCQSWSLLSLRVTQSYLGELVLLYCLQFLVFSLWVPMGWSTFPPTDMVYCLLRDWSPCHRNRRSAFLSHPLTCEWQQGLAYLLSASCTGKAQNSKSRKNFSFNPGAVTRQMTCTYMGACVSLPSSWTWNWDLELFSYLCFCPPSVLPFTIWCDHPLGVKLLLAASPACRLFTSKQHLWSSKIFVYLSAAEAFRRITEQGGNYKKYSWDSKEVTWVSAGVTLMFLFPTPTAPSFSGVTFKYIWKTSCAPFPGFVAACSSHPSGFLDLMTSSCCSWFLFLHSSQSSIPGYQIVKISGSWE